MLGHKKNDADKLENVFKIGFCDMDINVKALIVQIAAMFLFLLWLIYPSRRHCLDSWMVLSHYALIVPE